MDLKTWCNAKNIVSPLHKLAKYQTPILGFAGKKTETNHQNIDLVNTRKSSLCFI